jgi:predicted O-methyltransferase YrrM
VEALALALSNDNQEETWHNFDNKEFCEKLSLHGFLNLLQISGLTNNPDVILLSEYIHNANSILEIGGGYGRVINACQQMGFDKKLTTIEYAHTYASFLKNHIKSCHIIEGDFLEHSFGEEFDLILMMWTLIAMFCPNEQKICLKKCSKLLKAGGYCVIDLLISNGSKEAKVSKPKEYHITDQEIGAERHGYIPSAFEVVKAAAMAGLAVRQVREYIAGTANRCLVILAKS